MSLEGEQACSRVEFRLCKAPRPIGTGAMQRDQKDLEEGYRKTRGRCKDVLQRSYICLEENCLPSENPHPIGPDVSSIPNHKRVLSSILRLRSFQFHLCLGDDGGHTVRWS